ncbi:MAG: HAD-IA family hydrolase [Pseudomonadota bacterium]|nr:HAD-IA family hydrolase [Pseudomonadota bacterium]
MTVLFPIKTVLFDLDGTLVDTAPDLAETLNRLLIKHQRPVLSPESIRPYVSHGTIGMLGFAFGLTEEDAEFAVLRKEFLDIYEHHLCHQSQLFGGMDKVLDFIEARELSWGVVTNKPDFLTRPLMQELSLDKRCACMVSGDTLPQRKPDPAPMFHAAELAGSQADECVYLGDAERDIEAGNRAGMQTLVALYGYLEKNDQPELWQANGSINRPAELIDWIKNSSGHV